MTLVHIVVLRHCDTQSLVQTLNGLGIHNSLITF